jgi:hypothetical protein
MIDVHGWAVPTIKYGYTNLAEIENPPAWVHTKLKHGEQTKIDPHL